MKKLLCALVGRPNVGKSSLFNALVGARVSIVSSEAGTTRDRVMQDFDCFGRTLTLVDTGGVEMDAKPTAGGQITYAMHIREQVDIALDLADVIVFVVDGVVGVTKDDVEVAKLLRRTKKPIVLCANKLDNTDRERTTLHEFYELGFGEPVAVSCTHRRGLGDLCTSINESLPPMPKPKKSKSADGLEDIDDQSADAEPSAPTRIAIVGKPNAGKSSIINRLIGTKRVMVADEAGTTRDSIDVPFRFKNADFILTDTAGVRRKRSVEVQTVEHYSVLRSMGAIRSSDVSILVIDATQGITEQDVRLAAFIHNEGKPSVIVVNKWDLVEGEKSREFLKWQGDLMEALAFMPYFKSIFTSALTNQRISEIMDTAVMVVQNAKTRITTGKLNQLFLEFVSVNPTRAKIKYVTQVGIEPPTFAVFVSRRQNLPPTYERYLENCLRKSIDFTGAPIRIYIRENSKKEEE